MKNLAAFRFSLIAMVVLFSSNIVKGQCTIAINNLPDTMKVCKNTSVFLSPTVSATSGSPYYIDTFWTPVAGLSDPNIINPAVSIGTTNASYVLTVQSITPTNLLFNGDFSLGDQGFTSSYIYGTGGTWGVLSLEAQYAITTNPNFVHTNFANFGDHTTGSGNMLVVNGAGTPNVNIWCQNINVNPNTWYDFSAWGATCVASNPAILQFSINGILTGTPLALPITNGLWTQFHTTWFSGANTNIDICITDQSTAVSGNDFAIDDITFKEICSVSDSIYFQVINMAPFIQNVKYLGCTSDSVQFTAIDNGDTPDSYFWRFGDGATSNQQNPGHVYSTQGAYNVTLITSKNGCADSVTVNVNTIHPIDAKFTSTGSNGAKIDSTCLGTPIAVDAFPSVPLAFLTFHWSWGDGTDTTTTTFTTSHNYANAGTYNILLTVTDNIGCTDTISRQVYVDSAPYAQFISSDDDVCVGETVFFTDSISSNTIAFQWDFQDGNLLSNIHNPSRTWDHAGVINVTLNGTYQICPASTYSQTITVHEFPKVNLEEDVLFCPNYNKSVLLDASASTAASFLWNTGATTPSILVTEPGHYWVMASEGSCTTTDSIWVKQDCYLSIPNSFSPDGDGLNDYFLPRELLSSGVTVFKMSIFNRWGEKLFNTLRLDGRGWDGKYNGKDQPMGAYVYLIDVAYKNGVKKSYSGNVTLVR